MPPAAEWRAKSSVAVSRLRPFTAQPMPGSWSQTPAPMKLPGFNAVNTPGVVVKSERSVCADGVSRANAARSNRPEPT